MDAHDPDDPPRTDLTWGQRHGLTMLGVIALVMFALVIIIQIT